MDGGWSEWYNKTNCTEPCGGGVAIQQRTCTKPSPSCGGSDCVGPNVTNIFCKCCQGIASYIIVFYTIYLLPIQLHLDTYSSGYYIFGIINYVSTTYTVIACV